MKIVAEKNRKYNIMIWGAGQVGQQCMVRLSFFKKYGYLIDCIGFVDSRYYKLNQKLNDGNQIFEIPELNGTIEKIYSPEEASDLFQSKSIDAVLIGVSDLYVDEVDKTVSQMGIDSIEIPFLTRITARLKAVNIKHVNGLQLYEINDVIGECDNKAGLCWCYKDGMIFDECINNIWDYYMIRPSYELGQKEAVYIDDDVCMLAMLYSFNYWHFLYQVLDHIYLMEQNGYKGKYLLFDKKYIREILYIMDIEDNRIIWISDNNHGECFVFRHLLMFGRNSIKDTTGYLKVCANKILNKLNVEKEYPKRLFVKRIGIRKVSGIDSVLERYGFVTMIPEEHSVEEQIKFFHEADIIISPHGANSSNVMFCRDKSTSFIELFGYGYINPCCMEIIKEKRIHYQMIVETKRMGGEDHYFKDDYVISPVLLSQAIDNAVEHGKYMDVMNKGVIYE